MTTPFVKICGIKTEAESLACLKAGVRAVGINFVPSSKRFIGLPSLAYSLMYDQEILEDDLDVTALEWAGVFVDYDLEKLKELQDELDLDIIQLHGDESPEYVRAIKEYAPYAEVWKAFRVASAIDLKPIANYECDGWVLDAKVPGSGETFDWNILKGLDRTKPLILSGGLNPGNVGDAIRAVKPDWVDVASGVESAPGVKSAELIGRFVGAVKGA